MAEVGQSNDCRNDHKGGAGVRSQHRTTLGCPAPEAVPRAKKRAGDRDYWLGHCEGYGVESPGGRVGLVERVLNVEGRKGRRRL